MFDAIASFFAEYGDLFIGGTFATLAMTAVPTLIAYAIGIPIAMVFTITSPGSLKPQPVLNAVLGWIINMGRSIPYIILMVSLIPVSRLLVGTSMGVLGAIVPLTISAIPFVARMVENSFSETSPGLVEAAQAFGANTVQIITKVHLKESLPSLVRGAAVTFICLIGYSSIAGALGAGGLGDIAIRFGYYRYQDEIMLVTILIIIILVQLVQSISDIVARKIDKR
ncbi:MAG: ABC transporter permease [Coriobacteriales bacterium]|jgi:D-methionine transport system permease protein|nr:ABC transporter permease [Coriobacteriales bacterium]